MPPKKVAPATSASKLPAPAQLPTPAPVAVAAPAPKPVAAPVPAPKPAPAPAAAPKEAAPIKPTEVKVVAEHTEPSKEAKKEVEAEALKKIEEEEDPHKPSKWKRIVVILHKVFLGVVGVLLAGIGGIGYVQLFQGNTWEYAKNSYNVMISRILTNFWYVLFGFILWSGLFTIPFFSKFFAFTKQLIGLSIYNMFLGFAIQGGNLDGSSADFALFSAGLSSKDPQWLTDLNKIFYYVRGIAGLALIAVGVTGFVYGLFKKEDDDDEEEEEHAKTEKH